MAARWAQGQISAVDGGGLEPTEHVAPSEASPVPEGQLGVLGNSY